MCGLDVSVATDGTLYQRRCSRLYTRPSPSPLRNRTRERLRGTARRADTGSRRRKCGGPPLVAVALGLDGVTTVYHETIKVYAVTFPLSVGIAGGRPSSSYYFVGVQGNGHFYLDPHHSRPAVPLRPFMDKLALPPAHGRHAHDDRRSLSPEANTRGGSLTPDLARGGSLSPDFARAGSMSPEYGQGQGQGQGYTPVTEDELVYTPSRSRSASADPASGAPSSHPYADSSSRPNPASHTTPGLPIY
ncbi:hypothetical protein DFH09DRAFT_1045905 [Mycena vulgaris]|nr:hypothetical protein DFH09DRAFT_1045905 [Mycena vulgaris]